MKMPWAIAGRQRNGGLVGGRELAVLGVEFPDEDFVEAQVDVQNVSTRGIDEHDRLQARFDRIEAVNFQSRMMRLLNDRIKISGGAR